jgi:hypothetical protein
MPNETPITCLKCGASWDSSHFPYSGVFLFYFETEEGGVPEAVDASAYKSLEEIRASGATTLLGCPKDSLPFDPSLDRGDPYPNR